jgi:hypothetical protein
VIQLAFIFLNGGEASFKGDVRNNIPVDAPFSEFYGRFCLVKLMVRTVT